MATSNSNDDGEYRPTYALTPEWKAKVRATLEAQSRGAFARLAARIGCSTGQLTELLSPESRHSHLVPAIQAELGWEPVQPPFPGSRDLGTIRYLIDRADEEQRQYMLDAANVLLRAPGDDATQALIAMLRAFRGASRERSSATRIIVIDSDPAALRQIEERASERASIDLTTVDNVVGGMLAFGASACDLVVIDAALDGIEVCRRIKANPVSAAVPVVVSVGVRSDQIETHARNAGAWRVAIKPIDIVSLAQELPHR